MNLRWLVLKILDDMEFMNLFVHEAMDQNLKDLSLTKQERSFIKRLVYGVLEHRLYLDYVIEAFSSVKVTKMKPAVRHTLRLSVYQLLFMDSVPSAAVCDEAVKLIKKRKMFKLTGFVNGVLRNIDRKGHEIALPEKDKDLVAYLSVKYSYEPWLVNHLLSHLPQEAVEGFFEVSNETAPLTIRLQTSLCDEKTLLESLGAEGVKVQKTGNLEGAYYLSDYDTLTDLSAFKNGYFQVQDESAMLASLVAFEPGIKKVIDLCAAPGGKSVHLADLLGGKGQVLSYDLSEKKLILIRDNVKRLKLNNVRVHQGDAGVNQAELNETADLVMMDVPCSGLGIIRKKPDIKWTLKQEGLASLVEIQRTIMENGAKYVKEGGILLYATCTINPEENEENIRWFLKGHPEFVAEDPSGYQGFGDQDLLKEHMLRISPKSQGMDGFFITKLRKKIMND